MTLSAQSSYGIGTHRPMVVWRYVLTTIVLAAAGLVALLGMSLASAWFSAHVPSDVLSWDIAAYRAIVGLSWPPLTNVLLALFNDPGLDYTVAIAGCLGYLWWRRRADMLWAVIAIIAVLVVGSSTMQYMQWFGFRPRPFMIVTDVAIDPYWRQVWSGMPTFPSGHVRELAGLCFVLGYYWRAARWLAAAYLALVAFSRVYLGAHFPTDVLAGVIVGISAGAFSITMVNRARRLVLQVGEAARVRVVADYFLRPGRESVPVWVRPARAIIPLCLLMGLALAAGSLLHTDNPRILADYLRNTDNSLIDPLFSRFELAKAQFAYSVLAEPRIVFPSLVVLAFAVVTLRRRAKGFSRLALALLVGFAATYLVELVVGSHLVRLRPLTAVTTVPEEWGLLWSGMAAFPDNYLLAVMALCTIVAGQWRGLGIALYVYAAFAGAALMYFGAAWPTDVIVTLPVGYLIGRYALFLSADILSLGGGLGNDHAKRARDGSTDDRSGA